MTQTQTQPDPGVHQILAEALARIQREYGLRIYQIQANRVIKVNGESTVTRFTIEAETQ